MSTTNLSTLKFQISRLLWVEFILSIVIFLPALLPYLGTASFYITPVGCLLALIHSSTLLLLGRGRNVSSPFPPTSKLATIICTWILVLIYIAGFALALTIIVTILKNGEFQHAEIVVFVELVLVATQIGILVTIAIKCGQQRRGALATAREDNEYQLPLAE